MAAKKPSVYLRPHLGARTITLNRPHLLNTLDFRTLRRVRTLLAQLEDNPMVQVVILKGANDDVFSSGANLSYLYRMAKDPATRSQALEYFREEYYLAHLIGTYTKPIVTCMHGLSLGSSVGLAAHGQYVYSADNTVLSLPETGVGLVPSAGLTYYLSRMKNGVGMYLGLSGGTLRGEEVYWAGVTDYFSTARLLDTDLLEHAGELHSMPYHNECVEKLPSYLTSLGVLRESRSDERLALYKAEIPEEVSSDTFEEFIDTNNEFRHVVKRGGASVGWMPGGERGWYKEEVSDDDEPDGEPDIELENEEKGDLIDVFGGAEVDDRDYLPDPDYVQRELKNSLAGSSAHARAMMRGCLQEGPSAAVVHKLDVIKRSFSGDPALGDPVLVLDPKPAPPARDLDKWREHVRGRPLSADWESQLEMEVSNYVTDVYVQMQLTPDEAVAAITAAVTAAVPRCWPFGALSNSQLDELCQEFGVPASSELRAITCGALALVTSRLLNVPSGGLFDTAALAKIKQEKEDAEKAQKVFDDQGNEMSPNLTLFPCSVDDSDLFYSSTGTSEDSRWITPLELLPEDEAETRLPFRHHVGLPPKPIQPAPFVRNRFKYGRTGLVHDLDEYYENERSVSAALRSEGHPLSDTFRYVMKMHTRTKKEVEAMEKVRMGTYNGPEPEKKRKARSTNDSLDIMMPSDDSDSEAAGPPAFHLLDSDPASIVVPSSSSSSQQAGPGLTAAKAPGSSGRPTSASSSSSSAAPSTASKAGSPKGAVSPSSSSSSPKGAADGSSSESSAAEAEDRLPGEDEDVDFTEPPHSEEYLNRVKTDPAWFLAGFGLPYTEDTVTTAKRVTEYFVEQNKPRANAVCMPRSVEEIVRRLKADDTPTARAILKELDRRSPIALKATHRLIVEASVSQDLHECMRKEFRVLGHLLERPDTLSGLAAGADGTGAAWSSKLETVTTADLDALFARLPAYQELVVPGRHQKVGEAARAAEEEEWLGKLEKYWLSGEAPGYIGDLFKKRLVWL